MPAARQTMIVALQTRRAPDRAKWLGRIVTDQQFSPFAQLQGIDHIIDYIILFHFITFPTSIFLVAK
jgi:hypothetical protein